MWKALLKGAKYKKCKKHRRRVLGYRKSVSSCRIPSAEYIKSAPSVPRGWNVPVLREGKSQHRIGMKRPPIIINLERCEHVEGFFDCIKIALASKKSFQDFLDYGVVLDAHVSLDHDLSFVCGNLILASLLIRGVASPSNPKTYQPLVAAFAFTVCEWMRVQHLHRHPSLSTPRDNIIENFPQVALMREVDNA